MCCIFNKNIEIFEWCQNVVVYSANTKMVKRWDLLLINVSIILEEIFMYFVIYYVIPVFGTTRFILVDVVIALDFYLYFAMLLEVKRRSHEVYTTFDIALQSHTNIFYRIGAILWAPMQYFMKRDVPNQAIIVFTFMLAIVTSFIAVYNSTVMYSTLLAIRSYCAKVIMYIEVTLISPIGSGASLPHDSGDESNTRLVDNTRKTTSKNKNSTALSTTRQLEHVIQMKQTTLMTEEETSRFMELNHPNDFTWLNVFMAPYWFLGDMHKSSYKRNIWLIEHLAEKGA